MKQTYTIQTLSVHSFMQKSEKTKLILSQRLYNVYLEFIEPRYNKNTMQYVQYTQLKMGEGVWPFLVSKNKLGLF